MKAYFASLTDLQLRPVDAHVATIEEGATLLAGLAHLYADHDMVLRARTREGMNRERKFIGLGRDAGPFIDQVREGDLPPTPI